MGLHPYTQFHTLIEVDHRIPRGFLHHDDVELKMPTDRVQRICIGGVLTAHGQGALNFPVCINAGTGDFP
ncbi:hypothetical protein D3C81_727570 [compost metagenome]